MSSRWILRSFVLVAVVMLALPVVGFAQTSRVEGMNLQGDYIKDYTGIYTYASGVASVGNLVYGELGVLGSPTGSPADRSMGAVLGNLWDGNFGTWAVHLRELSPTIGQGDFVSNSAPGALGFDPNVNTNEAFDLMWGKKFGTTSLGLRLNRSFVKVEGGLGYFSGLFGPTTLLQFDTFAGGNPNLTRNVLGFGGGLGFEVNPNTNAEVGLLWQKRTYELSDSLNNRSEDDGPTTYQLAGRAFWQWQPNCVVVPVVKWYSYDLSEKTVLVGPPASTTSFDNSLKGWQVGAAGNWTLGTNDLFVLGATFAQNKVQEEEGVVGLPAPFTAFSITHGKITETIAPQIFASLETHINTWLTLRFGANKSAYHQIKVEATEATNGKDAKFQFSPFSMALGAGVKLGTLQLDAVLNDTFPQTLGGFFSNSADYVSFSKVTATYPF